MTNGPYRDSIENRIVALENKVTKLEGKKSLSPKIGFFRSIKEIFFEDRFLSFIYIYAGIFLILSAAISVPIYLFQDNPETVRAERAERDRMLREHITSCENMGLSFVGYYEPNDRLTCGNDTTVVAINIRTGDNTVATINRGNGN